MLHEGQPCQSLKHIIRTDIMYARDPDENAVDLDRPFSRWQRAEFFELARVGFWLAVVLACMAIMIGSIVRQWRMLLPLARELGWI